MNPVNYTIDFINLEFSLWLAPNRGHETRDEIRKDIIAFLDRENPLPKSNTWGDVLVFNNNKELGTIRLKDKQFIPLDSLMDGNESLFERLCEYVNAYTDKSLNKSGLRFYIEHEWKEKHRNQYIKTLKTLYHPIGFINKIPKDVFDNMLKDISKSHSFAYAEYTLSKKALEYGLEDIEKKVDTLFILMKSAEACRDVIGHKRPDAAIINLKKILKERRINGDRDMSFE